MRLYWHKDDFVGKTIKDLSYLVNYQGIAIFDLNQDSSVVFSNCGVRIWEDILMRDFIKEFPQYENAIVEDYNDFFGEIVLRIRIKKEDDQ